MQTLWHGRIRAFVLTFLAYMCIHIVRKPSSVLKSVLHPQDSFDFELNPGWAPFNHDLDPRFVSERGLKVSHSIDSEQENGLYACHLYSPRDDRICVSYFKAEVKISRLTNNPYCEGRACWVITRRNKAKYVQLFDGALPQALSGDDPHLQAKAWRLVQEDGTLTAYDKLRVEPNTRDGKIMLGLVDTTFLMAYTVGLFVSGFVADRVNIRLFLGTGMLLAGASSFALGMAYKLGVHSLGYFLAVSAFGGLAQSVGWPCVVAVMGRWFPKEMGNRGLIMGGWNANIFVGNIIGNIVTTAVAQHGMHGENWPLGYQVPGMIVFAAGLVILLWLQERPPAEFPESQQELYLEDPLLEVVTLPTLPLIGANNDNVDDVANEEEKSKPPSLLRVLLIPGIVSFSLALCFAKMAQYALLFWGPYYLQVVGFSSEKAGYLCSFFDVGGLCGGIAAGFLSDYWGGRRGTVACLFLFFSSICLLVYYHVTSDSSLDHVHILMMILVGFWVNGPVSLITTAVSADLGSHPTLNGDERLIGSVAGIIDGSGSFGAAMQGVVIGVISSKLSWDQVFHFLALCCLLASMLLSKVVWKELYPEK
ncbi:hypothetical protein BASA81_004734 [Batrachochytrium salamandrivorans]|nr:hypothetical protein BASA81_004734 [Batrachochytrium salamandrivorans]